MPLLYVSIERECVCVCALPSDISSSLLFLLFSNEASGLSMIHTRPRRKHDRMCMCRGA